MIPNRLLEPIAFIAPVQLIGLIVLFRWTFPEGNGWTILANLLGFGLGLLLPIIEIALFGELFWGKKRGKTASPPEHKNHE